MTSRKPTLPTYICKSLRVPSVVLLHVIAIHHHSERGSNGPMARITPRSQDSEIDIQQPPEGGNPITGYKLAKAGCGSVHSCRLSRQVGLRAIRLHGAEVYTGRFCSKARSFMLKIKESKER